MNNSDNINTPPIQEKQKNYWFNRVYLCWEYAIFRKPDSSLPIKGFKCYRFNNFENANNGRNYLLENDQESPNVRHTMIPICKWVPQVFDKYILNWKLQNIYWKGHHMLGNGDNIFKKK
jgi:hypothetical protein